MSTFDKIKAQEDRRAAIKRQMDAMEAAADPRSNSFRTHATSSSTTRRRSTSREESPSSSNIETARQFLWDEDEDGDELVHDHRHSQGHGSDRRSTFVSGQRDSMWLSMTNSFRAFGSGTGNAQPDVLRNSPRLAEVNLRGESQRNFDIDDEGPVYRPSMLTSIYISIRRLMLGLALAAGGTYQYTRSRWEMAMSNGRGKKLFAALFVILAIVIPVSIVLTKDNGSSDSSSSSSLSTEQRRSFISERILESGMSLEDELTSKGTPQNLALEWIVSGDHAELAEDHDYLLQRYALAVFFYSTHGDFIKQPSDKITTDKTEQIATEGHDDVTRDQEKAALAQPDWINQNRWMSSYGICAWHGIQCHHRPGTDPLDNTFDDEGDIILMNMTDNNIRGFIPRELFVAHPYTRWLSFSGNGLYGTLPTEIGFLDDLRYLALSNNDLEGSLPTEIGQLTSLTLLFLDENNFVGRIPTKIGALTGLVDVSLYDNLFTGTIPTEFGLLQKLESLYFDVNHLIGSIPSELGTMKHLNDLRLRHNHFIGAIPTELANLDRLEILYMDQNELTGTIPLGLAGLEFLSELHLYGNKLKGSIPTELANLRSLVSLYLDNNHLTGEIPTEFGNLIDLQELYIHKNYLNGTLPTELGKMSNLRNFRAYTNGLYGPVPDEISKAWQIHDLYLHDNLLTGTLPVTIKDMNRLQRFRVYWNDFVGTVPMEICDLTDFKLSEFKADCDGENPSITCKCCTECFS